MAMVAFDSVYVEALTLINSYEYDLLPLFHVKYLGMNSTFAGIWLCSMFN